MSSRLPINPLLYLVITGLLAASAWQFWQFIQQDKQFDGNELVSRFRERIEAGRARQPDTKAWNPEPYRTELRDVNFVGKLPPKPEETKAAEEETVEEARPVVPLSDIFKVRGIIYDSRPQEDDSRNETSVIIEYLPTANVQPPESVGGAAAAVAAGAESYANQNPPSGANRSRNARNRQNQPGRGQPMPTFGGGPQILAQTVYLYGDSGSTLWPEYDHIKLVRVDEACEYAVFQRQDPTRPKEEWEEEKVYKDVLDMPQEILAKLAQWGSESARERIQDTAEDDTEANAPARDSGWVASPTTVQRETGEYNLGRDVVDRFRDEPDRIFADVGLQSYSSRKGNIKGLRVTRVPSALQSAGVRSGDIILSVNGDPVRSKSQAYSVGKRKYQMGERRFEVKVLRANGQVDSVTYLAPDK